MILRGIAVLGCILTFSMASAGIPQKPAPGAVPSSKGATSTPVFGRGETVDGVYRNPFFGFTLKLPYGWVDRTEDLRLDSSEAAKAESGKSTVLLAIFERPPESEGKSVNSAIVIAVESVASYPGLKSAAQYFGPIGEIAKQKDLVVINQPYDFPIDGMPIVRQDFSKKLGGITMYQSSMALIEKGYVVSFTFIAGSLDDITQTLDDLRFGRMKPAK